LDYNIFVARAKINNANNMKLFKFITPENITTINQALDEIDGSHSDTINFTPYLSVRNKNSMKGKSDEEKYKYIRSNLKTIVDEIWLQFDSFLAA
jgi:predicted DNA-binding ribbon-helix-helix protein